MKVQPVFNGKIHVTAVKNEKWSWYDYETSAKDDEKILEVAKDICPYKYTLDRQHLSKEAGDRLRSVVENAIGEKLDIPEDPIYSTTYSPSYNFAKDKNSYSILLFCQQNLGKDGEVRHDRTAVDIYI